MSALTMPMIARHGGVTTYRPMPPTAAATSALSSTHKRTRMPKRPARAVCNDSTGQEALMALERRLKTMRLNHSRPSRPTRPVQLAALSTKTTPATSGDMAGASSSSSKTAVATGMTPRRPRFMKPLMARDNAPTGGAPTPTRPAMPNPGFASPRRPVSATMPRRPRVAPSILKRRRTRSATTRRPAAAVRQQDYVPDGMIVSLPPLLPTHSLLADAYTQGYDCGATDSDMESIGEIDTDTEEDHLALSGSLGGSYASSDRPSVAVPSSFVHDMLASLDDSLEEGGFSDLLKSARTAQAHMMSIDSPHIPEEVPLNDSPTLILDALTPAGWAPQPRSPTGFSAAGLPSLSLDQSLTFDFDMPAESSTPAPVPATTL